MPCDITRPEQLTEWPELACLEVLQCAADAAFRALVASFPILEQRDFILEHDEVTPQLCLAAAVSDACAQVDTAVERYRVHIEQLTGARGRRAAAADPDLNF